MLGAAETSFGQASDELLARHQHGASLESCRMQMRRDVVVVALEGAARDAENLGERVQLVDADITHHVTPPALAVPPLRRVDEDHLRRVRRSLIDPWL